MDLEILKKGDPDYHVPINANFEKVGSAADGAVKNTGNETIAGVKNFKDGLQAGGVNVVKDNQLSGTLAVGNGNAGSVTYRKQGKIVTLYLSLNGKNSGGNDSIILTLPAELRPSAAFEVLVGSDDRSALNTAEVSISTDGAVRWRRNSSYASGYNFAVTYQTN